MGTINKLGETIKENLSGLKYFLALTFLLNPNLATAGNQFYQTVEGVKNKTSGILSNDPRVLGNGDESGYISPELPNGNKGTYIPGSFDVNENQYLAGKQIYNLLVTDIEHKFKKFTQTSAGPKGISEGNKSNGNALDNLKDELPSIYYLKNIKTSKQDLQKILKEIKNVGKSEEEIKESEKTDFYGEEFQAKKETETFINELLKKEKITVPKLKDYKQAIALSKIGINVPIEEVNEYNKIYKRFLDITGKTKDSESIKKDFSKFNEQEKIFSLNLYKLGEENVIEDISNGKYNKDKGEVMKGRLGGVITSFFAEIHALRVYSETKEIEELEGRSGEGIFFLGDRLMKNFSKIEKELGNENGNKLNKITKIKNFGYMVVEMIKAELDNLKMQLAKLKERNKELDERNTELGKQLVLLNKFLENIKNI